MAPVTIRFGDEARAAMLRGIDRLADAVAVTLGPGGRTVLIEGAAGTPPRATRDGVTVAEALEESGRWQQLGLRLVRQAARTVGETAGDGTTTTIVLARALCAGGMKAAAAGLDVTQVRHALNAAVAQVADELRRRAVPVRGPADILRVATISAGGDAALGRIVADAFAAVGVDGVVTVEAGRAVETSWRRVGGWQWEGGYVSPYFMTDPVTTECVYEKPLILLTEDRLDRHAPLLRVLEASVTQRRPLLIVAAEVTGEALQTLVANKLRNGLRVVAGKAPLFGDRRRAMLDDIAAVTGATPLSAARGDGADRLDPSVLGRADRIVLTRDRTTVIGGAGTAAAVSRRIAAVRSEQDLEGNTPFQEKFLRERLARLSGGVAAIAVGGGSEAEIGERRDRAEDAANAVRAAAADGLLPGGGAAYIHAASVLVGHSGLSGAITAEERAAHAILRDALRAPAARIAANAGHAGHDGESVAARIAADGRPAFGFDARTGRYGDLLRAGVIDPAQVTIAALEAAASVAALLLSAEVAIAKPAPPPRPTTAEEIPFGPEAKDMTADEARGFGLA